MSAHSMALNLLTGKVTVNFQFKKKKLHRRLGNTAKWCVVTISSQCYNNVIENQFSNYILALNKLHNLLHSLKKYFCVCVCVCV